MSLALIQEAAKEVRRLAIAGSPLAVGDFRLKKLAPPLEQAGAKVPVFAQVAKAINDVVNGPEAEASTRLLSLSTLLNAILYTQGQSGAEGELRELEIFATNCTTTRTTGRVLKPLIEALTSSGGGRFEMVKSAVERGAFNDLRLIDPAIQALGDSYPELADLVAEKILPAYGPGIVPRLKSSLDLKGKKHDARKLQVMHQVDPDGTLALCQTALEDGSADVKIAAIACLGQHADCLPLVLEQTKARNKEIRAAALAALAGHNLPEITKMFLELVAGKTLDILIGPFRSLHNPQVLEALLAEGRRMFALLIKNDPEQITRFCEILNCLDGRKEPEVQAFLLECFAQSDPLGKVKAAKAGTFSGSDLQARLTMLLHGTGSSMALEAILAKREALPLISFGVVLRSAVRSWTADKVFTEFSPLLGQTKGAGKQKSEELQRFIFAAHWDHASPLYNAYYPVDEAELPPAAAWDPRWLDAAIKADLPQVVCFLARPGHPAALEYVLKLGDAKKAPDAGLIVQALMRCGCPQITDYYLDLVTKKTKQAKFLDHELRSLFNRARLLPKTDLPKLDDFAAKLDEKFVDAFLEAIAPLRPTTPEPQPTN
jgi:hypothetical protein